MNALAADQAMPFGTGFVSGTPAHPDGALSRGGKSRREGCAGALDVPLHGGDEALRNKAIKLAAVILLHGALAVWLMNAKLETPELTIPIRLDVRTVEVPPLSAAGKAPVLISEAPKTLTPQPKAATAPRQVLAAAPEADSSPSDFVTPSLPASGPSKAEDAPSTNAVATQAAGGKTSSGSEVSSAARFDADYLNNPAPPYPPMSRRRQEEGRVILNVKVMADGRAEQVTIRQGSGYARLDEAALSTVQHWRFVPARSGNQPVAASVLVPIEFRLGR